MKNLKERQLAVKAMKSELGFAPRLEDIIPLESSHLCGECSYVLFEVKGDKISFEYRANTTNYGSHYHLEMDKKAL